MTTWLRGSSRKDRRPGRRPRRNLFQEGLGMRTRVLFALTVAAALAVVANAEATWPQMGGGYYSGPTYKSGTVIGGPMYAATPMYSSPGYTIVERTGPFGLMRWRTMEPTPTMIMPQPVMIATTDGTTTTTGVMPAIA